MSTRRKLGLLLAAGPEAPGFQQGVRLAEAALRQGVDVYLYCIDEAVRGAGRPELQGLKARGLKLFACAYGAHQRGLPLDELAVYAGLTMVGDLAANTHRFVCFT